MSISTASASEPALMMQFPLVLREITQHFKSACVNLEENVIADG